MKRINYFFGAVLLLLCQFAQATPITWTISDAVFDDGGTMTGVFTFDESTNLFTDVLITTTLTSNYNGSSYTSLNMFGPTNRIATGPVDFVNVFFAEFHLTFSALLTDAGGTVSLLDTVDSIVTREGCVVGTPFGGPGCNSFGNSPRERFLVSGTAGAVPPSGPPVSVPEPTTLGLLGLGLFGIGLNRRKRLKSRLSPSTGYNG